MGHQSNSLRHLGMIATSGSWRRHLWAAYRKNIAA